MDFQEYLHEWESHYDEAEKHGGLQLSTPAKCWLFWSRTTLPDRAIAELRLKVDGDLNRHRDMISLHLRITKNEFAAREQSKDYRGTYNTDLDEGRVLSGNPALHDSAHHDPTYDSAWYEDDWDENYDYDEEYDEDYWYDYDDYDYDEYYDETYYDDYYGGKKGKKHSKHGKPDKNTTPGKGKFGGKLPISEGCTHCGSRWHKTQDCPIGDKSGKPSAETHQA